MTTRNGTKKLRRDSEKESQRIFLFLVRGVDVAKNYPPFIHTVTLLPVRCRNARLKVR